MQIFFFHLKFGVRGRDIKVCHMVNSGVVMSPTQLKIHLPKHRNYCSIMDVSHHVIFI
jgi:hypothetical protein